jgi:hypothetical protein
VVCCGCCCSSPSAPTSSSGGAVVVALVSAVVVAFVVVVVFIGGGLSSVVVDGSGNGIPLSHLHNVTWLSLADVMSSTPTAIIPFNGASIPVELVWKTAVTMPFPQPGAAGLNCTIS